jgi:uncharacterized membrane protein YdjX (TVP38/TMEM64 family)
VDSPGRLGLGLTLAAIVLSAALVLAVPELRDAIGNALRGDTDALRTELRDTGAAGVALLVGVILIHAVVFYPSEIVNAAAGVVYGFGTATAIVVPAWLAANLGAYYVGRHAGRPLLRRLAGDERLDRAARFIERGGVPALLVSRLIPIMPMSLVGYVAGATHVPFGRFAWTTLVGTLPLTLGAVLLGARLDELSLTDPLIYVAMLPFVLLAVATRPMARRLGNGR